VATSRSSRTGSARTAASYRNRLDAGVSSDALTLLDRTISEREAAIGTVRLVFVQSRSIGDVSDALAFP